MEDLALARAACLITVRHRRTFSSLKSLVVKYADDNELGGTISFSFKDSVDVGAIGLIDIDENEGESSITVIFEDGSSSDPIPVVAKGDNSYQVIEISLSNVSTVERELSGIWSSSIHFILFLSTSLGNYK